MGFLIGNDFIPHLPHLHISHDALPLLYKTYISVLPSLGGEARSCTLAALQTEAQRTSSLVCFIKRLSEIGEQVRQGAHVLWASSTPVVPLR